MMHHICFKCTPKMPHVGPIIESHMFKEDATNEQIDTAFRKFVTTLAQQGLIDNDHPLFTQSTFEYQWDELQPFVVNGWFNIAGWSEDELEREIGYQPYSEPFLRFIHHPVHHI